jgi:hypothetical protein
MSLAVRRCLRRSHLVEELVEAWQIDHRDAMAARDLEELIQECLELKDLCEHAWNGILHHLFNEQTDDIEAVGKMMLTALEKGEIVFSNLITQVLETKAKGYEVDRAGELEQGLCRIQQLKADYRKQWPSVDYAMVKDAREAYLRGDYRFAEDILHDLENGGPGADQ